MTKKLTEEIKTLLRQAAPACDKQVDFILDSGPDDSLPYMYCMDGTVWRPMSLTRVDCANMEDLLGINIEWHQHSVEASITKYQDGPWGYPYKTNMVSVQYSEYKCTKMLGRRLVALKCAALVGWDKRLEEPKPLTSIDRQRMNKVLSQKSHVLPEGLSDIELDYTIAGVTPEPTAKKWVNLTDNERDTLAAQCRSAYIMGNSKHFNFNDAQFADLISEKLRLKNGGVK